MEGLSVTFSRALTDHVLRHHELFSSVGGLDLGNIRPLIPLNVDPPQHSKYRKILDPLFAPKQMDAQEADITARVNHFIDTFIDAGECNFSEQFAELLPSSVFLGLMGLPWDYLDTFLRLRDGILRPDKFDPNAMFDIDARMAVQRSTGQDIYEYFNQVCDEREKRPTDDILTHLVKVDIDGERLTREEILDICFRARHGERLADVLLRVLGEPPAAPAAARGESFTHSQRGGGAVAMGVTGAEWRAAHRDAGLRASERRTRPGRDGGDGELRRWQRRPFRVPGSLRGAVRS
jgi:hypothetical protein